MPHHSETWLTCVSCMSLYIQSLACSSTASGLGIKCSQAVTGALQANSTPAVPQVSRRGAQCALAPSLQSFQECRLRCWTPSEAAPRAPAWRWRLPHARTCGAQPRAWWPGVRHLLELNRAEFHRVSCKLIRQAFSSTPFSPRLLISVDRRLMKVPW